MHCLTTMSTSRNAAVIVEKVSPIRGRRIRDEELRVATGIAAEKAERLAATAKRYYRLGEEALQRCARLQGEQQQAGAGRAAAVSTSEEPQQSRVVAASPTALQRSEEPNAVPSPPAVPSRRPPARKPPRNAAPAPPSRESRNDDELLFDTKGARRGRFVSALTDDDGTDAVLRMMLSVWKSIEVKKLRPVAHSTPNLLHYNMKTAGFPMEAGADDRYWFKQLEEQYDVSGLETMLSDKIRRELLDMGYCSEDQKVQFYLSFLKSLHTEVQPPHIDYQWDVVQPPSRRRPRGYRGNFEEYVPWIALFPLTEAGMTVEVWGARDRHDPARLQPEKGRLVDVPYGEMLLLRADVVHAGGFTTCGSGNPRGHLYIYKTPHGVQHSTPLKNAYDINVASSDKAVSLLTFYEHCDEGTDRTNDKFIWPDNGYLFL